MTSPTSAPLFVIASDLDNTLVFGSRHNREGVMTYVVENIDGEPTAFVTARAHQLWHDLTVPLIPVTTRTRKQLDRLTLPVRTWAVCSNGGQVLHDDVPDPGWNAIVRRGLAMHRPLSDVQTWFSAFSDDDWVRTVKTADDLFVYVVAQNRDAIPDGFALECSAALGDGWSVSVQGRKVYAVPDALSKAAAVRHVVEAAGWADLPLLTAGDSLLDIDLIELGVASGGGWWPAHGELGRFPELAPRGSERVGEMGVLAGEALLEAWYARSETVVKQPVPR